MTEELIKTYGVPVAILAVNAGALLGIWRKASATRTEVSGDNLRRLADRRTEETMERDKERLKELEGLVATLRASLIEYMLKVKDQELATQKAIAKSEQYRIKNRQLVRMMSPENKANQALVDAYQPTDFSPL